MAGFNSHSVHLIQAQFLVSKFYIHKTKYNVNIDCKKYGPKCLVKPNAGKELSGAEVGGHWQKREALHAGSAPTCQSKRSHL